MAINPEDSVEYVPEHNENRDLPEEEQVVVNLVPMTGGEFRAYTRSARANTKNSNLEKVVERIIIERVVGVKNYIDILGREATTAKELFDNAEVAFIDEVFSALTEISMLKGGLRKK